MAKFRKQPRRSVKNQRVLKLTNPFRVEMPLLPVNICENLKIQDQISLEDL